MSDNTTPTSKALTPVERSALIPSIASHRFAGLSEKKISEALDVPLRTVRSILNDTAYDEYLKDMQNQALKHSMASFRSELNTLSPLAVKALKENLEAGKIDAVALYAKLIGALKPDEKAEQVQNIQVVLPEGITTKTF